MGKLVVNMFVTLDGVIQGPGAPTEDTEGGFRFGGWQASVADEEGGQTIMRNIERCDALLLGRKTYDIFQAHWPKQPDSDPVAKKFNRIPKFVVSHDPKKRLAWNNASVLKGELAAEISRIKKTRRDIQTWGSASLIPALLRDNLIDQLDLWVYPVVLGTGKRLFAEGIAPAVFRLTRSETFPKGAIHATYEPAGTPTFGTIGERSTSKR